MPETTSIANLQDEITQFIATIVCHLVDDQNAVRVHRTNTVKAGVTLHVKCASQDIGKLIGKQGRTARSLRTILEAVSVKHGMRYWLDLEGGHQNDIVG